ncbi:MAG: NAD(P)-dependent oxidoreductase [Treponema sp.]|jgi:nucleoside-diphosphate-sugar epimerase|nr:NAD(P)-dependent oxidoreductase [Treponema sp.]
MAKKVLVTGGSGRLGNFVCPYLKEQGYNVSSFDMAPSGPDSPNVKAGLPFVQGSLTDLGDCMRAISFGQPDVIVHLGAIRFNSEVMPPYNGNWSSSITDGARYGQRLPHEWDTMEINTMGSYFICDAARRMGVKNIVAASSYFVLGIGFRLSGTNFVPDYLPMDENHPLRPEDSYSLSKVLGEEIYQAFIRAFGLRVVAMRLLGVYYPTPGDKPDFNIVVPEATAEDKGYLISNTYQYVDARDISRFVKLSIEADNLEPFEAFYVSTDTKYNEPTAVIAARRWPFLAEKAKNIPGTEGLISIKKAERLLGYKPAFSWRDKK